MARCPFANWEPLPANERQAHMTPRLAIAHTAVDAPGPTDLYNWFVQSGLESHFFVRNAGAITQYMDTGVVAEANYRANPFAVSIETEDDGRPEQTPWTEAQLASLIRLLDWLCDTHPIPRRQADRWDGAGLGWHSMWGLNTRANPNINPWTSTLGKTCPGAPRIVQMRDEIIPRIAAGETAPPAEEEVIEMTGEPLFYAKGNKDPAIYLVKVQFDKVDKPLIRRRVELTEWNIAFGAGVKLAVLEQAEFDAIPKVEGSV